MRRTMRYVPAIRLMLGVSLFVSLAGLCPAQAKEQGDAAHSQPLADVAAAADAAVNAELGKEGHGEGTPDYNQPPLEVNVELFLFTLLLFGAFVLVMRPFVWQPLLNGLAVREGRIAQAAEDARAARREVHQLTAQAEQRLAVAYEQVAAIVSRARVEAEARKAQIVAQAEAEAQRIKSEALAAIAAARSEAMQELERTVDRQVELAAEQIGGRRL